MKLSRPDLAAMALCALIVLIIGALAGIHVGIPDVLPYLATAALSAGAGVALNIATPTTSTKQADPAPAQAPARVPAQPAAPVLEQAAAAPVATHAP